MTPDEIFALMGGRVVLIMVRYGTEEAVRPAWQKLTLADMTESYLSKFNGYYNIGVSLGVVSEHRISIDLDKKDRFDQMLELNPDFKTGLLSWGARGGQIWLHIDGWYPDSCNLYIAGIDRKNPAAKCGELRADRRYTVISGRHPSGCDYHNNGKPLITTCFNSIKWPADFDLPWMPKIPQQPPPPPEPEPKEKIHARICAKYGKAFYKTSASAITLNENYFVRRFQVEHNVLFEQKEEAFYLYRHSTGAWHKVHYDHCRQLVRDDFVDIATRQLKNERLLLKGRDATLNAITNGVRVVCGAKDLFKRLPRAMIHCANGMFQLHPDGTVQPLGFSPDYYSRNPIPIPYDPSAKCPRFMAEILERAMDPDDESLFLRWFGSCLLAGNKAQKFLMLIGSPQSSKTLLINIVEMVIGRHNTTQLRTWLLHERFEIGRFEGKTLLTGKDVDGNFLQHKSAHIIKALVGKDYIPGEIKGAMGDVPIMGDFDMAMTCNETLKFGVKGESDRGAWRRRTMIIPFSKQAPERISDFDEKLIATEGPGILALAVKGAMLHLAELEHGGDFKMTSAQLLRIDKLLEESESAKFFVQKCIYRRKGSDLTSEEIAEAYNSYCEEMGWRPDPMDVFKRQLPNLMMEIHGAQKGTNAQRASGTRDDKTRRNSYGNVALAQPEDAYPSGENYQEQDNREFDYAHEET
jgi:phage/plasmid-associated DNA primase